MGEVPEYTVTGINKLCHELHQQERSGMAHETQEVLEGAVGSGVIPTPRVVGLLIPSAPDRTDLGAAEQGWLALSFGKKSWLICGPVTPGDTSN
jgi:hypothetical protein